MQTLSISQDLWDVKNDYPVPESQEELVTWTTTKQKDKKRNMLGMAHSLSINYEVKIQILLLIQLGVCSVEWNKSEST